MADQVAVSREIAASPDRLWAMVSDVTRMGEWSPETEAGTWLAGATGPAPGAEFEGANRNGEKHWTTKATVIAAEKGRRFAFRVDVGPIKVSEWDYTFDPTAAGCTVTERWTDKRNRLAKAAGGRLSGVDDRVAHNRRSMEETLTRLATAAESGGLTPGAD